MVILASSDGCITFTGPRATRLYRLQILRTLLRFEVKGMPNGRNPFPAVEQVLREFDKMPDEVPRRRSARAQLYLPLLQGIITSEVAAIKEESQ